MGRLVCISFVLAQGHPELDRMRALDPGLEIVVVPYMEDAARRNSRHAMTPEELRSTALPLTDEQRRAFAEAEVLLALDVPIDLGTIAPKLRWVQIAAAGVEHLAGSGLDRGRVLVTNASGIAATSIAEFVIGRLLAVWKRFEEIRDGQHARQWVPTFGRTFSGSVIGVIGVGAIGAAVAQRAGALGARVLGVRRSGAPRPGVDEMFTPDRMLEMLGRCDAVVLAAPGGEETRRLIDRDALRAMRPGAVFCNVARGSLVDEGALLEALRGGHLAAAVLDVFEQEPLPAASPLWEAPNTHLSAHCSVSLDRYADDVMALFADNLDRYLRGASLRNRT